MSFGLLSQKFLQNDVTNCPSFIVHDCDMVFIKDIMNRIQICS